MYVSHNMNTIRQLCDRCVVLENGKIIYDGDVEEAISIYMKMDYTDQPAIDYNNIPRLKWLENTKIRTCRAEYTGKDSINYTESEKMHLKLEWENEQDINDLCLRIEILKADRTPIGTGFIFNFYSGKKGEKACAGITLDINNLAPGKYATNYTFFQKNEYGTNINVDCVHGLYFSISPKKEIVWDVKQWGQWQINNIELEML